MVLFELVLFLMQANNSFNFQSHGTKQNKKRKTFRPRLKLVKSSKTDM